MRYKALVVREEENGGFLRSIEQLDTDHLPDNDVLIRVHYSALNYKDALSATGHKGITRQFPHTPGIDAAGEVISDRAKLFHPGQQVLVTSYDLGMNTAGGFGEYIRVPAEWVIPLPEGMTLRRAMILGTAGFTAALALHKMEQSGQKPEMGPVLVTGSTGGVGTMALMLLKKAGYQTIASTGKPEPAAFLRKLGADEIQPRSEWVDESNKPFLKTRCAGAIDTVGGKTLSTILKSAGLNANIAVCGLVDQPEFSTTVYPFIIKGNNLLGVESATCDRLTRMHLWNALATHWTIDYPEEAVQEVDLQTLNELCIPQILAGQAKGRVLLKHEI